MGADAQLGHLAATAPVSGVSDRYTVDAALAPPHGAGGRVALAESGEAAGWVASALKNVIPLPTVAITSVLAWLVAAGLAVGAATVDPALGFVPAAVAAVAVPSALRATGLRGLGLGLLLLSAGLVPFEPAAAWGVAAVFAVGALSLRSERAEETSLLDLQRHLAWCRRLGADADVLVVTLAGARLDAETVRNCFRLTDSVRVSSSADRFEVVAVLDTKDLSRSGVEQRVHQALDPSAELRWARFPADGVTLEALIDATGEREAVVAQAVPALDAAR
jgi:type IV secretory pathway TrbD component